MDLLFTDARCQIFDRILHHLNYIKYHPSLHLSVKLDFEKEIESGHAIIEIFWQKYIQSHRTPKLLKNAGMNKA